MRAYLIPYTGEVNPYIYRQYKFNEAWDGPNNTRFWQTYGDYYCPAYAEPSNITSYVAVAGGSLWPNTVRGVSPVSGNALLRRGVLPGSGKALLIVELVESDIVWAKPEDITLAELNALLKNDPAGIQFRRRVRHVLAVDATGAPYILDPRETSMRYERLLRSRNGSRKRKRKRYHERAAVVRRVRLARVRAKTSWRLKTGKDRKSVVFRQTETTYDPAGNVIFVAGRSRLATSGTATGALSGSGGLARSSYTAGWFDGIGRPTVSADYGINGGTAMNPPTAPVTIPTSGALVLVGSTVYNPRGEAFQTIDPKGRVDQQVFDDAGRAITTIQNVVSGGTAADQNVTVQTAYTPDGQVATLTALNVSTGSQTTQYAYGTSTGTADSGVARTDLLKAVIYPDSSNTFTMSNGTPSFSNGSGTAAVYNRLQYTYNQLGEQIAMMDQNQTVHAYGLDGLGRPTSDSIASPGSGVNASVQQIARSYEVRGMLQHVLSYSNSSGTGRRPTTCSWSTTASANCRPSTRPMAGRHPLVVRASRLPCNTLTPAARPTPSA